MPTLTGTLPSVNQRFSALAARSIAFGAGGGVGADGGCVGCADAATGDGVRAATSETLALLRAASDGSMLCDGGGTGAAARGTGATASVGMLTCEGTG